MPRKPRYSSSSGNDGLFKTIRNFFSGKPVSLLDPLSFEGVPRPLQDISDPEQGGDAVNKQTLDALKFTNLSDTPDAYTGEGGSLVVVDLSETGVTFTPISNISHSDLADLDSDDHEQYALLSGRTGDELYIDNIHGFTDADTVHIGAVTIFAVGGEHCLQIRNIIANSVSEETPDAGVTIDGVLLKDGAVSTDTVNEKTSGNGVVIDGVLLKDNEIKVDGIWVRTADGDLVFRDDTGVELLRLTTGGKLSTGGETAPDCLPGGITIRCSNALSFPSNIGYLTGKHTAYGNNPFSAYFEADTIFRIGNWTDASGSGAAFSGISGNIGTSPAVAIAGVQGQTTQTGYAAVVLRGNKHNGSGGLTGLTSTEKILEVKNYNLTPRLFEVYGTGIVSMPGQISVGASRITSAQSIPNNTGTTIVFNSETNDDEGCYNTTNGVFTVPAGGTYQITARVIFASNATGYRYATVRRNGGASKGLLFDACSSERAFLNISDSLICDAGDTLDISVIQTSGGALDVTVGSSLNITKIT